MSVLIETLVSALLSCSSPNVLEQDTTLPEISTATSENEMAKKDSIFTAKSTVGDVITDRAFGNFGRLLFPVDRNVPSSMTLAQVSTSNVYVWYSNIKVDKTVEILNYLHNEVIAGKQIFYNIYSDTEISSDRTKADTGLFFFRGDKDAPFAIVNAGGGFMYVGAMHDSFPHSLELSKNELNAFALIYRPDKPYEDLARAIEFIHDNATTLGVKVDGYSLWGGSAGARMAAVAGNKYYLQQLTGRTDLSQAASVIMQYTGYSYVSEYDAPTYVCVGKNDGIASWRTMQRRLQQLSSFGIPTEFHAYDGLGHGFGLGTGTIAEGWINDAIKFWQNNIR